MTKKQDQPLQDPLPESSWTWRRLFTFSLTITLLVFVWFFANQIGEAARAGNITAIENLTQIIRFCLYLIALGQFYYLIAPSAEIMTKIIQAAATLRTGVGFKPEERRKPKRRGWGRKREEPEEEIEPSADPIAEEPEAELDEENQPPR